MSPAAMALEVTTQMKDGVRDATHAFAAQLRALKCVR